MLRVAATGLLLVLVVFVTVLFIGVVLGMRKR